VGTLITDTLEPSDKSKEPFSKDVSELKLSDQNDISDNLSSNVPQ